MIFRRVLKSTMENIYFENIQQNSQLDNEEVERTETSLCFKYFFNHEILGSISSY